jgi:hypothetical protein
MPDVLIIGRGEADLGGAERYGRGLERKVRYADAVAWTITAAIADALTHISLRIQEVRDNVGLLTCTAVGPRDTMADVAASARIGQSSPLKFAAANPGSVTGLACVAFQFRGPTRNLAMSPSSATSVLLAIANQWLRSRVANAVILSTFAQGNSDNPVARCLVLALEEFRAEPVAEVGLGMDWISLKEHA